MNVWPFVLRRISVMLMFVVIAMGAMTFRVISDGNEELAKSDAAFNAGDLRNAMFHARRAATLYAPGAEHVTRAYERLAAIAVGAEAEGRTRIAFLAWQAMRAAALETRHLWVPHQAELERADQNIARISQRLKAERNSGLANQAPRAQRPEFSGPRPFWVTILGAGFALTALGLGIFAFRGISREGKFLRARAGLGLALAILGAACWTLAVYKA